MEKARFDSFWQQNVLTEDYVGNLLNNGIFLSAFTVCPLGSIRPMGVGVLYGTPHPGRPKCARALQLNEQRAWDLVTGQHAPSNVLGRANKAWAAINRAQTFFGRSYHSATPQAWAEQVIGFNMTHALASHIQLGVLHTEAGISPHATRGYTAGQNVRACRLDTAF